MEKKMCEKCGKMKMATLFISDLCYTCDSTRIVCQNIRLTVGKAARESRMTDFLVKILEIDSNFDTLQFVKNCQPSFDEKLAGLGMELGKTLVHASQTGELTEILEAIRDMPLDGKIH